MAEIPGAVAREIEPLLEQEGFELVLVQHEKGGGSQKLRVLIDKEGGVSIDDCEKVAGLISPVLDATSLIQASYVLEVSSPGFDRPLTKMEDYTRFVGQPVKIKTHSPIDGMRVLKGTLGGLDGSAVILEINGSRVEIPVSEIAAARLDL